MKLFFLILIIFPVLTWECQPKQKKEVNVENYEIFETHNQIHVLRGDQHIATYLYDSVLLKPILYPVHSPSGIRIQRQYPLSIVEGESHDHPHHAGLFFTYGTEGEVNGNNFWAGQEGLTKIQHSTVKRMETEPGRAILQTQANWIGAEGNLVMLEDRTMVFSGNEMENVIDFTFKLTAGREDVVFKDTKEGMFAIRVADWLSEANGTGMYLSSFGDTTEANVWGKSAKWVRLEGHQDGKKIGIVIMNHPGSVNFPTYWHARGYGLFSANPLGQSVFQEGRNIEDPEPLNFVITTGNSAIFKFKMIIYEGDLSIDQVEAAFESYSL